MAIYVKVNNEPTLYPAEVFGRITDYDWDNRNSKSIHATMEFDTAKTLFQNDTPWSIVMDCTRTVQQVDEAGNPVFNTDETGNQIPAFVQEEYQEEYNNDEYCVAGAITDNRDGTVDIKMGMMTDLEKAYSVIYGGVEEMPATLALGEEGTETPGFTLPDVAPATSLSARAKAMKTLYLAGKIGMGGFYKAVADGIITEAELVAIVA